MKLSPVIPAPKGHASGLWDQVANTLKLSQISLTEAMNIKITQCLDLDAEQSLRLMEFADELDGVAILHQARQQEVRAKVSDLLIDPRFDEATAKAVLSDLTRAYENKMGAAITRFRLFYDSLSPVQRYRLRDEITAII